MYVVREGSHDPALATSTQADHAGCEPAFRLCMFDREGRRTRAPTSRRTATRPTPSARSSTRASLATFPMTLRTAGPCSLFIRVRRYVTNLNIFIFGCRRHKAVQCAVYLSLLVVQLNPSLLFPNCISRVAVFAASEVPPSTSHDC